MALTDETNTGNGTINSVSCQAFLIGKVKINGFNQTPYGELRTSRNR